MSQIKDRLYANSPFNLASAKDNAYRDGVDYALEEVEKQEAEVGSPIAMSFTPTCKCDLNTQYDHQNKILRVEIKHKEDCTRLKHLKQINKG